MYFIYFLLFEFHYLSMPVAYTFVINSIMRVFLLANLDHSAVCATSGKIRPTDHLVKCRCKRERRNVRKAKIWAGYQLLLKLLDEGQHMRIYIMNP